MFQRIIDFFTTQSIQASSLSTSTRLFRLFFLLAILGIPTLLCGFFVNFKVAFQMWLLFLAAIIPLVGGFFLIWKYQWNNQKTAFFLSAGLLGFVAFELSLLGWLIDPRSENLSIQHIFISSLSIGFGFFIVIIIGSLLFSKLNRIPNGKS